MIKRLFQLRLSYTKNINSKKAHTVGFFIDWLIILKSIYTKVVRYLEASLLAVTDFLT